MQIRAEGTSMQRASEIAARGQHCHAKAGTKQNPNPTIVMQSHYSCRQLQSHSHYSCDSHQQKGQNLARPYKVLQGLARPCKPCQPHKALQGNTLSLQGLARPAGSWHSHLALQGQSSRARSCQVILELARSCEMILAHAGWSTLATVYTNTVHNVPKTWSP